MIGSASPYLGLITSEHAGAVNFVASVKEAVQGFADNLTTLVSLPPAFDLDLAEGVQLDTVGVLANRDRYIAGSPLGDDAYRTLLQATIAAHHWDSSVPDAYDIWDILFAARGIFILIFDNHDMSMDLGISGAVPDAATYTLFTGGYLSLRPSGVRINQYIIPTAPGGPLFAFDADTPYLAGFDVGVWAEFISADFMETEGGEALITEDGEMIITETV
jgi:hypothetical protein